MTVTVNGSTGVSLADTNAVPTAAIQANAVTQAKLATGVAGTGPAFSAYANTNQSLSSGVVTKVNFGSEVFDTNSNFDTSTSRFTPTVAGYYQINASIGLNGAASTQASIFKNGSVFINGAYLVNSASYNGSVASVLYMNGSTDYLEIYMYAAGSSIQISGFQREAYFNGALVRAA